MAASSVSALTFLKTALVCRELICHFLGTSSVTKMIRVSTGKKLLVHVLAASFLMYSPRIFVPEHKLNIDLDSGDAANGTTIHLWSEWSAHQQTWRFEEGQLTPLFDPLQYD